MYLDWGRPSLETISRKLLVIGSRDEQPMVIERKLVVTESYAKHHANQHLIYNTIPDLLMPHLSGDLYALEIDDFDLRDKTKLTIQVEAMQIVDNVLADVALAIQGNSISGSSPFPWRFGRVPEFFRDESAPRAGIGVIINTQSIFDREPSDTLSLIEQTDAEYRKLVDRRLGEAQRKFLTYVDHRKVVVLEFYGDWWLLDEDDARKIVREVGLPPLIDEVWITNPEWVPESDYEIVYEQVR
jgi:hypothetical protein